ncbi:hypothetical protein QSJ18_15430 [Gordonia sp. ABSL1-1]|uniref:hypothetical protein n=1 Tax=Gordonia sp. ABSL1-1 TaxID=3053923 RepID=UPI002573EE6B|nr:hypothetical protein [Gordonia sp. ABSL1-1]MDL9938144.1 hypothetical protein [Gordonia sp. ABSL1-1]
MSTTNTPRQVVDDLRAHSALPRGDGDRFAGYGVMGMPFASGHYLALRDLNSSIGDPYRSVWLRDPQGQWTFYTTTSPRTSCPHYFATGDDGVRQIERIEVDWADEWTLRLRIADVLDWRIGLAASPATRAMTTMSAMMPGVAWRSGPVLSSMGPMAHAVLRSGRIRLCGRAPSGARYFAAPLHVWRVRTSAAELSGQTLGRPAPLSEQIRLGSFWLPQRGLFFAGNARFVDAVGSARVVDAAAVDAAVE